jgi:glycosyltransferase involved in cell wall biosynthesis
MTGRRALVIAPRLPEFDRESGLLRTWHLVDMLLRRGWGVTFGCLRTPTDPERYTRELEVRGVETHAPLRSLDEIREPTRFDLAIIAYWHVAERFLPELRQAAPSTRVIVDSVDLHFLRDARERLRPEDGVAPGRLGADEGDEFMRELNTYGAADAVLTVSEKEAALINDLVGSRDLAVSLPDAEDMRRSGLPLRKRRGILFLGNFLHAPNSDAASYLCEEIVPRLDQGLLAEHPVTVVGTAAEEHVPVPTHDHSHVKIVGWVPSVVPYLHAARVSIVPLRYGAGTKRKVIQALMAGTPTVTSSVGAEGIGLRHGREVLIADDPGAFAAGIERLLRRPLASWALARRGRAHAARLHGRAIVEEIFDRVLDDVLARRPRPARPEPIVDDGVVRSPEYERLVARVREVVESEVPSNARVLVASRGDHGLLSFSGRSGWHFPRDRDGKYAGYYPADSGKAIAHLEELRAEGATHLVLPETAFWWLTHYEGFQEHLDAVYRKIRGDEHAIVYDLAGDQPAPPPAAEPALTADEAADSHEELVVDDLVTTRRPAVLAAASRYRNGGEARRALVLGVYLAGKPNTAEHVASTIARSRDLDVRQRWVALGGEPTNGDLGAVTASTVTEPTPKFSLLNRLIADEDLSAYDFVVMTDDDIVVPDGFLDLFLGVQARLGLDLAQPARTLNSYVDHPIVLQQLGLVARRTLFVEIGPLVSFGREIYDLVFPFDESNPMGWGFENVWSYLVRERGGSQGIVDAVPVDHSIRPPVEHYKWSDAVADRERYLARVPHLPLEECFSVLETVGVER